MKICLINNLYKLYSRGGAEKVTERLETELLSLGHEVFVIATAPDRSHQWEATYYLKSGYYNLNHHLLLYRLFWQACQAFNLKKRREVKKILLAEKPDLIIANNLMGLSYLLPGLFRKLKIKHIQILHDIQLLHPSGLMFYGQEEALDNWLAQIYQIITRRLFNSPDLVVAPSRWLLDLYRQRNFFKGAPTLVLRNPLPEFDKYKFDEANRTAAAGYFNLLYVGQIEIHKGILFLISAFTKISDPDLRLLVVGNGSQINKARKLAGGDDRIEFLGPKTSEEINELMNDSQGLVVPSLVYENSPTVIYEAAMTHLPFIAARIGGIPELVEELGGLLFKPDDEDDLITKIEQLIDDYQKIKTNFPKKTLAKSQYAQEILARIKL